MLVNPHRRKVEFVAKISVPLSSQHHLSWVSICFHPTFKTILKCNDLSWVWTDSSKEYLVIGIILIILVFLAAAYEAFI